MREESALRSWILHPNLEIPRHLALNPAMRSLTLKLSLAFLAVALTVAGLAAVFARNAMVREFDRLVVQQAEENFIADITAYHETFGSWDGVHERFGPQSVRADRPPPNQRPPADAPPPPPQTQPGTLPPPFFLADQDGIIVISGGPKYRRGDVVPAHELEDRTAVEVDGIVVGTVFRSGQVPELTADEQRYLERINQALLWAGLAAGAIAIVLGVLLARTLTRPVREMTAAARAMAKGDFKQTVPVRSQDELGELATAFNQMSVDLDHANQARRQMTADVAHDLRTPLTVLSGYLESMQDGVLEPTPERLALLNSEVQHLNRLVDDLRTLSLADAGELSLHRQLVSAATLLARVASSFEHSTAQKGVELKTEIAPKLPEISVDTERMVQGLSNLVGNALKNTPTGGEIHLKASAKSNAVVMQVQDTGSGIAPDALPYVFKRFYRGDASRRREDGDSGLGLAIARSIVEAHGGEITVASQVGEGTTFSISLPTDS